MSTPYAYHLYHTPTGKHYYGIQYRKGCGPVDLWTTYYTSSAPVHKLIEEHGAGSFVPTVRRTFESAAEAVEWEAKFLARVDAQNNDVWLNRHNGKSNFIGPHAHTAQSKDKIAAKITGIKRSKETKAKMSIAAKERQARRRTDGWSMPKSAIEQALDTRAQRIAAGTISPYSDERNQKIAESKRGKKRKYLPDGSFVMVDPSDL